MEIKKYFLTMGLIVTIVVVSVLGITWFDGRQPVKSSEYSWIDSLVEQCPPLKSEVEQDLKKGYITNSENTKLWKRWNECRINPDEQRKNEIIKKYTE